MPQNVNWTQNLNNTQNKNSDKWRPIFYSKKSRRQSIIDMNFEK